MIKEKGDAMDDQDLLREAMLGIKRRRKVTKLMPFDSDNCNLAGEFEIKGYVPGQGIIHNEENHVIVLSCGHIGRPGIVGECGHVSCEVCVNNYRLECAGGCLKKLCLVPGCYNSAHFVGGVPYCEKHGKQMLVWILGARFFVGKNERDRILNEISASYYGGNLQIRSEK